MFIVELGFGPHTKRRFLARDVGFRVWCLGFNPEVSH